MAVGILVYVAVKLYAPSDFRLITRQGYPALHKISYHITRLGSTVVKG
jgi:hypothetical protein